MLSLQQGKKVYFLCQHVCSYQQKVGYEERFPLKLHTTFKNQLLHRQSTGKGEDLFKKQKEQKKLFPPSLN